jgi:hypothetical protein
MRASSIKPAMAGFALAAAALLSACANQNGAAPASTATPENKAQQQLANTGAGAKGTAATGEGAEDVNCSANGAGQVGPAGGQQVDLIAVGTKAGRVGCTEAFTVIENYYRDAPTKSEGTAHVLNVSGWTCMADTGAQGSGAIGCDKDGLAFRTAPAQPPAKRFAGKTLVTRLTGYNSKVDMVEFHLVHFVAGGANNGHYETLPGDPATHRLPLAKSADILSIIGICSNGMTADAQGHANKPCTKQQLVDKLSDNASPYAEIQVDEDDNIAKVSELYAP